MARFGLRSWTAIVLLALGGCCGFGSRCAPPCGCPDPCGGGPRRPVADLVGTKWAGTTWDGARIEMEFLPEGVLRYSTWAPLAEGTWTDARWAQDGDRVTLLINAAYATYEGALSEGGRRLSGTLSNVRDDRGTFEVRRVETLSGPEAQK